MSFTPILRHPSYRYFVVHKPFNMVSQFVSPDDVRLLGDLDFNFPEGTHAIGRLDSHSEGLLILTTNRNITRLLFQGKEPHKRTYLVQVLRQVNDTTLQRLRDGISIHIKGDTHWVTSPCEVNEVASGATTYPTHLEFTDRVPTSWLEMTLTEGKFHQVRKMVYAAGHKCRRLIRTSIEDLRLDDLPAGHVRELQEDDFFNLLHI
jgi:23S rRNA pseudouridine2457 synthase